MHRTYKYLILAMFFFRCSDGADVPAKNQTDAVTHARAVDTSAPLQIRRIVHQTGQTCVYINDSLRYCGFGFDYQYIFPRKGHNIFADSALISIPYDNGTIWYEGIFVRYDKRNHAFTGRGLHKVYHKDGTLKAEIDYKKRSLRVFYGADVRSYTFSEYKKIEPHMVQWTETDRRKL